MMASRFLANVSMLAAFFTVGSSGGTPLEVNQIIDSVYVRDSLQRADITDLTVSAESFSRKLKGDGRIDEEKRFLKTYYFRDTLFKVEFHEYFKNGEKQPEKQLQKEIREAEKRRQKGRSRDASVRPLLPFYPDQRDNYRFTLVGQEEKQDRICYRVRAECLLDDENLLEGDYWLETESYNLIYTRFGPAKLPGPIKQLDMEMVYRPVDERYWLMDRFHMYGRGKVIIFIKFYFEVEEIYSDYRINTGLREEFFREDADGD